MGGASVHCIAGLLKLYIASLPSPLLPTANQKECFEALQFQDPSSRDTKIRESLQDIPIANRETLRLILLLLVKIVQNVEYTQVKRKEIILPRKLIGALSGHCQQFGPDHEES